MATRLDRLFLLLETGSTSVIRKSAAEQLGEVQKLHPHELNNLLSKIHLYLCSSSWDTRIAASQAVDAVSKNVPVWNPTPTVKQEDSPPPICGQLSLSQFDINRVLKHGASLLASEGKEFEEEEIGLDDKERLAHQKQQLNKRLGLDVAGGMGINTEDLFREEDLVTEKDREVLINQQSAVQVLLHQQTYKGSIHLSARERNRAKRKAKMLSKQSSRDGDQKNGDSDSESACKLRKTSSVLVEQPNDDKLILDNIPDNTLTMDEMDEWPFETFCEVLMNDLFHSTWERRHGAALGLREVMKLHGSGAGKAIDYTVDQMGALHQLYLEDLAVRLISVLALDRFGDYISDEVVAPVRETCAQTLGVTLQYMTPHGVTSMVKVLMQLLIQPQWEVRHGGLLGLKYLLAIRKDLTETLLPVVLHVVFCGLKDRDDDVRAVAAAALLPAADILVTTQAQHVPHIIQCLWHTLLDLDDLTASTNSIMSLLSTLLAHPKVLEDRANTQALTEFVPRLWPFLKHNISSVRKAALDTLYTLLSRCRTNDSGPACVWLLSILQDALRHLYQRALLEEKVEILQLLCKVWSLLVSSAPTDHLVTAAAPWAGILVCLMMQPPMLPFDPALLIEAKHAPRELTPSRARHAADSQSQDKDHRLYIAGMASVSGSAANRDAVITRARKTAAKLLGTLCTHLTLPLSTVQEGMEMPLEALARLLVFHLSSKSAIQRVAVGIIMVEWAKSSQVTNCPDAVKAQLHESLVEPIYFDEIAMSFTKMQTDSKDFIASLRQQNVDIDNVFQVGSILTLDQAQSLCTTVFDSVCSNLKPKIFKLFDDRRKQLLAMVEQTNYEQLQLTTRVQASLAGAAIWLQSLPDKMNPVVRPLMDVLKKEHNHQLQMQAAEDVSHLVHLCVGRAQCPTPKIIKNLCAMLCSDPAFTPVIGQEGSGVTITDLPKEANCDKYSGILTLYAQQVTLEGGRGRKATMIKKPQGLTTDIAIETIAGEEDEDKKQLLIQRRGSTLSLQAMAKESGASLVDKIPQLWETMTEPLKTLQNQDLECSEATSNVESAQSLINSLQTFEICGPSIHPDLHNKLTSRLPDLGKCLEHPFVGVRHMSARCLGMLSKVVTMDTMNFVMENILPNLGISDNERKKQGAIESMSNIIDQLGINVIPYIVLLVVPILGCMSDFNTAIRLMATYCFATLVRLMPLESSIPDPPSMKAELVKKKEDERRFLEQLLDGSKVENYKVSVPINAELRKYQQDGVNWLAFLNKYKLHGILCDDMGLGKTLQSICILASDHQNQLDKCQADDQTSSWAPLPSIVVCPPTLTGHWVYEIEKFVQKQHLNPLHYHGPPAERHKLQKKVKKHNLVVASYDVVRNDIDFFGKIHWKYCILDEGHIIKNSKTKISKAVKQLRCCHRVILSGTPIQNNVLELWSLFDFLMPGFLGSEKQFQARFGKPILQSRDAKSSTKDQEAGALAMEALHRQVLPFLLRRLKEDVLKDLPPKIIQDYYCDLSPLQVKLYEDFAKSRAKRSLDDTVHDAEKKEKKVAPSGTSHIFQALQYLRKVCNHPALVLTPHHPQYEDISRGLKKDNTSLRDLQHAPKLMALKQLLLDCGIGVTTCDLTDTPVVNQHRVLLFCQLKSMLDIVEKDVLSAQMPSVTFLRLDGSVPPGNRHSIVNRFNNDPSIDILLLTTHVGGLGLNLAGADTVIFVEHDWNPMKDLQAMDRAHRIGQKKVVNVYRLVTRGTLEEKIMGLQKFKLKIANTIITQDNSSLSSMGTDQLLDLFSLEESNKVKATDSISAQSESGSPQKQTMRSIVENLEELWDEKQYESEYNMDSFIKSLEKQK